MAVKLRAVFLTPSTIKLLLRCWLGSFSVTLLFAEYFSMTLRLQVFDLVAGMTTIFTST